MHSSGQSGMRPVQLSQKDAYKEESRSNSDDDCCDCNWPDEPIAFTTLDKRLWDSLLNDGNCDWQRQQNCSSNGSNNRWVGTTSEELIPPSAMTPEAVPAHNQREGGAPLRCQLTLARTLASIGGRTQTISGSSASRPARVVNWAAEACDRRWGKLDESCEPVGIDRSDATTCGEAMKQCTLRKARLMSKRLPQSQSIDPCPENLRPKSKFYRLPIRTGGVNGVELFLSSVVDSPQPQSLLRIKDWRGSNQRLPQADLRQPDEQRQLPHTNMTKLWHPRLLDVKTATVASTGSQDGSACHRIPSSDAPWQQVTKLPLPVGTSEVTMDISGDSLSPDSVEDDEPLPRHPPNAARLPVEDGASVRPSVDWRNVVSISVIAGGGQTTTVAEAAAALVGPADAATLAPLTVANSKTASTNTEQSASTTMVVGASGGLNALDARAAMVARFASKQDIAHKSAPLASQKRMHLASQILHRREPQLPLSLRRHPRPQMARILQRHGAVSLAPVWLVCGSSQESGTGNTCVASLRHCLNNFQFAWQSPLPARCSRAICQLLMGPRDVSQSSESQFALQRIPVYVQRSLVDIFTPVASIQVQTAGLCIKVTAPEVLRALRYITPSQTANWLPPKASISSDANNQSPLAMLWSQGIRFVPQPANSVGLQFPSGQAAECVPPIRPMVFQVASVSETGTPRAELAPQVARKSQHLQELRRIVRMKMQQKMQIQEFVGVTCSCCSCCSSPPVEAVKEAPGGAATEMADAWGAGQASRAVEEDRGSGPDPLERSLGGLLDSLRSCRHTASVAAKVQRKRRHQSGDRQLASFIEKILRESTSQQAALNDLLASLKNSPTVSVHKKQVQRDEGFARQADKDADEEASTKSNISGSQSDQFYSFYTGHAGQPPDASTRVSGRTADVFGSPCETQSGMGGFGADSANNNAEAAFSTRAATPSPDSSGGTRQGRRHRRYYARRRLVRLEECAALVVHETASQACSLVSNCLVHQRSLTESKNSSDSCGGGASAITAGDARKSADDADNRQNLSRLRAVERRALARAWRHHPPIPQHLLDALDPTVASFIWWSLIPRCKRIQLSPDVKCAACVTTESSSTTPTAQLPNQIEVRAGKPTSSSSEVNDSTRSTLDPSLACELEISKHL